MRLLFDAPPDEESLVANLELSPLDAPESPLPEKLTRPEPDLGEKLRLKELEDGEKQKQKQKVQEKQARMLREAEETLRRSVVRSSEILDEARRQAEKMKEEARQQGYEEGFAEGEKEGEQSAKKEGEAVWQKKTEAFEKEISSYIRQMDHARDKVLEKYIDDLKDISLAVAEKIIRISLKDSGEVVKRMILSATEKLKKKSWVKVYIAQSEREMRINGDRELLEELSRISDNVKIVSMEEAEPGTCIVEMPDEIIDASVSTQLENIRDIVNNARM